MKYDKLFKEAHETYPDKEAGDCLLLCSEGDKMRSWVVGSRNNLGGMLATTMQGNANFAEIVLDVAAEYIKGRMVRSIQDKEAKRQAYQDMKTKTKS